MVVAPGQHLDGVDVAQDCSGDTSQFSYHLALSRLC